MPPVSLAYFRPRDDRYVTAQSQALSVQVQQGAVVADTTSNEGALSLRHIHTGAVRLHAPLRLNETPLVAAVLLICFAALGAAWWRRRREDRRRSDPQAARAQQAARAARAALGRLGGLPDDAYLTAIGEVLVRYLSDKLGLPASGITVADLGTELVARGLSAAVAADAQALLAACQVSRFAPTAQRRPSRQEALAAALALISELERERGERQ